MGADTNTCLQPTVDAPPLGPCLTIDHALDLAQANPGADEVLVADGTYAETLTVGDATLLRALDTTDPKPVINNSPTPTAAVTIPIGGGSIDGFQIRSDFMPLSMNGAGSVANNDFPTTAAPTSNQDVFVGGVTGAVLIAGNSFSDDGVGTQQGIFSNATSATSLTIQNNDFNGLQTAIWLQNGDSSPLIAENDIAGIFGNIGRGIDVYEGSPVIRNNMIHAQGAGVGTPSGVSLSDTNGPAGAALSRNTIAGISNGVVVTDTSLPVTLNGDLITGSAAFGLQGADFGLGADISATNTTIFDNLTADVRLQDDALTLDSSIIGNAISANATATCSISFSRGPTLVGPANGCGSFQTLADPMFVTPGTNYHLQSGSPMIDAGNTLDPGAGVLDIDGNPRALSSTPACTLMAGRRDIGADEFVPATGVGCPLPPAITPTPTATPAPRKKCKKGRKLKKGKCVKKKRKR